MEESSISQKIVPVVGMRCTKNYYTDRRVCTVVEVKSEKTIVVKDNEVKCGDYYDGSDYEILDELIDNPITFTLRNNGRWIRKGDEKTGLSLTLNSEAHYVDPSF
jgi:hypothetical protein